MPNPYPKPCLAPGCATRTLNARCTAHTRPSASARGYGADWARRRLRFLIANPVCALCGQLANVADHHPRTRRQLLDAREPDADDARWLRPLCTRCHNRYTATHQPRPDRQT